MEIFREFEIEAARRLPQLPEGHKCRRLHGHTFRIAIHVAGAPASGSGWVMDFAEIDRNFQPIREALDHRYLNEIAGLENPTSENLARWIWARLAPVLPGLCGVAVRENPTSGCIYRGEDVS